MKFTKIFSLLVFVFCAFNVDAGRNDDNDTKITYYCCQHCKTGYKEINSKTLFKTVAFDKSKFQVARRYKSDLEHLLEYQNNHATLQIDLLLYFINKQYDRLFALLDEESPEEFVCD